MKLDSKYFDSIRVKPRGKAKPEEKTATGTCQWRGCTKAATHRAPRGRGAEGAYYNFCVDHVRTYNKSYNYFSGMSDDEFIDYQKSAATGHRPTWTVSSNGTANVGSDAKPGRRKGRAAGKFDPAFAAHDPHGLFGEQATPDKLRRRPVRSMERKALSEMHLPEDASKAEIKARFKELVKRHHPDSNGGDRGAEDKLREVIQAYNYLKKAGLA
ncbi:MAG: J domain-containing protein [Pseudomonadota bacterium]